MNLSDRQIKLIKLLFEQDEKETEDYAQILNTSAKTVERYIKNIYAELNVKPKNRIGIMKKAIRQGWIDIEKM